MVDFADVASDLEQERLTQSLNNRRQFDTASKLDCEDCGSEIPTQRRSIGGVTWNELKNLKSFFHQLHFMRN